MPTVGKKKYPYTKAGKAAAKKALDNRGLKRAGKAAGKIGRSPSQIRKMGAAMKRASNKRKAGKGYKK